MFLLGPSANILPYLLVILVPLIYYIEGGTGNAVEVIQHTTFEEPVKTSINFSEIVANNQDKEPTERVLHGNPPIQVDHESCPFKLPHSLQFINIPLRAPPVYFD